MKQLTYYLFAVLSFYLFVSCETDNYDKGEGEYSLMRADFVQAHVGSDKRVDYVVTDDGDSLAAEPRFTIKSIETADTVYRAILYYNKVKNGGGKLVVEARSMSLVPTLSPLSPDILSPVKTDPLKFESLWLSGNGRYLNASIILMTGKTDEENLLQSIALVRDSLLEHADGTKTLQCRLYHDQNGVPEYYSVQRYFSVPIKSVGADSIQLAIQTYTGLISKTIAVK